MLALSLYFIINHAKKKGESPHATANNINKGFIQIPPFKLPKIDLPRLCIALTGWSKVVISVFFSKSPHQNQAVRTLTDEG
jgi:hypothetical protein